MKISVGGVIEIQTAIMITEDCQYLYVALKFTVHVQCSSIIHKGTQKIWSDFNKAF